MKNKKFGIVFALLLIVALGGTALAYMVHKTPAISNSFNVASVSVELSGNMENQIVATNKSEIDVYIRVRLSSHWINGDDEIVSKASEVPDLTVSADWIADTTNDTYYYKYKVSKDNSTTNLLSNTTITLKTEDGYRQVVQALAEIIQADPAAAIAESWGATVDANGVITAIS